MRNLQSSHSGTILVAFRFAACCNRARAARAHGFKGQNVARYVLIIEDRPSHAKLFSEILRGNEVASVVALSGREGVAVALRTRPSLVVVDILLPDLDGRKVVAQIRGSDHNETTPIIAISAVSDRAMETDCLAAGANVFLAKPVGVARFSKIVAELLAPALHRD
jgi:two-component system cell cycle response regulator DivK